MIIRGTLMLPDGRRRVRLAEGWLSIDGDRIDGVNEGPCPHQADLGGDDQLIMPGFVDAHLHLPQIDSIGVDGLTLLDWLEQIIYPAEARWADADFAAAMTRRAVAQLRSHGTLAFAAYSTVHHEATCAAIDAAAESGVRAVIGQTFMDQHAPEALIRPTDQLVGEARALIARGPRGRVAPSLNPRFAITCSRPLLAALGELAARTDSIIQTHLAETVEECERVRAIHGADYVRVYEQTGLLGPRSVLAHAIHLTDADRRTLTAHGCSIAHCPTANVFLRSGTMDRQALLDVELEVALGSDIAGGPDRSMVRVARSMVEAAKALGHPPPSPAECFAQITHVNADALGWPQTARLAPGAEADVLVAQPDVAWRDAPDPLAMLLYTWDDRWLTPPRPESG